MKEINNNRMTIYHIEKRLMDITVATIAIIISSPILIVVSIIIKLTSAGPVFAREMPKRVGLNGKLFFMYKFRSMIVGSHQKLRTDPKFAELYEEYKANNYKIFNDPRCTPFGKFLRKTSIDEFPQFFNVLRGEMSIVGHRAYFSDELEEQGRHYPDTKKLIRKALTEKPGITGPWQVSGRSNINFTKRIKMDAEYADKKSIIYDIYILLKTPLKVIIGKGAY